MDGYVHLPNINIMCVRIPQILKFPNWYDYMTTTKALGVGLVTCTENDVLASEAVTEPLLKKIIQYRLIAWIGALR